MALYNNTNSQGFGNSPGATASGGPVKIRRFDRLKNNRKLAQNRVNNLYDKYSNAEGDQQDMYGRKIRRISRNTEAVNPLKMNRLYDRYNAEGATPEQQARIEARLGKMSKRTGLANPLDQEIVIDDGAVMEDAGPTPEELATAEQKERIFNTLFPSYEDNFDYYADQGQAKLKKLMASRGMGNSTAEINANKNFLTDLSAKSTQGKLEYGNVLADRLERMTVDEANRMERMNQDQINNYMEYLRYLQDELPTDLLYESAQDAGKFAKDFGTTKANYLKNAYEKLIPSTSGGGLPFMAPFPQQNNTNSQLLSTLAGSGSSSYLNAILGGLTQRK